MEGGVDSNKFRDLNLRLTPTPLYASGYHLLLFYFLFYASGVEEDTIIYKNKFSF